MSANSPIRRLLRFIAVVACVIGAGSLVAGAVLNPSAPSTSWTPVGLALIACGLWLTWLSGITVGRWRIDLNARRNLAVGRSLVVRGCRTLATLVFAPLAYLAVENWLLARGYEPGRAEFAGCSAALVVFFLLVPKRPWHKIDPKQTGNESNCRVDEDEPGRR